jgi:[pyruvate, water dikinase]-phosphate phosphotransferase / [pyruvate, water dikinase] kinase
MTGTSGTSGTTGTTAAAGATGLSGATVLVASDATGETGEKVVRAALVQFFHHERVRIEVLPHVNDEASVRAVVEQAKARKALLVYTLVGSPLRALVRRLADESEVRAVDLLGGLLLQMAMHLGEDPMYKPGLGHELDAEYFRRMEAVEFAVNNDDGREPRNLKKAEVVLVGVSRTSKTPLSQYIANKGYRVANVPLVKGIPPPKEIATVDPRRIFALLVDPSILVEIRRTRLKHMGVEPTGDYGDPSRVREELAWARDLYAQHPQWTVLDISGKAIEETAALIVEKYRSRFETNGVGAASASGASGVAVASKPADVAKPSNVAKSATAPKPPGAAKSAKGKG